MTERRQISRTEVECIKVDLFQIPEHVKNELASATIRAVTEFLKRPGAREFMDRKIALKKVRKGAR